MNSGVPCATRSATHDQAEDQRDDTLADTAWESVCAAILVDQGAAAVTGPAAAAVTLRAALADLTALTPAERALLGDWQGSSGRSAGAVVSGVCRMLL